MSHHPRTIFLLVCTLMTLSLTSCADALPTTTTVWVVQQPQLEPVHITCECSPQDKEAEQVTIREFKYALDRLQILEDLLDEIVDPAERERQKMTSKKLRKS